jgi:putative transposase
VTRSWRDYVFGEVFAERLWRPGTYEEVFLGASDTVSEARASIGSYLGFYHGGRPYSRRDRRPPDQASFNRPPHAAAG